MIINFRKITLEMDEQIKAIEIRFKVKGSLHNLGID